MVELLIAVYVMIAIVCYGIVNSIEPFFIETKIKHGELLPFVIVFIIMVSVSPFILLYLIGYRIGTKRFQSLKIPVEEGEADGCEE